MKIGETNLPETIKINGNNARLTIYAEKGKGCLMYIYFDKEAKVFDKFETQLFRFDTIEEGAESLRGALLLNKKIRK